MKVSVAIEHLTGSIHKSKMKVSARNVFTQNVRNPKKSLWVLRSSVSKDFLNERGKKKKKKRSSKTGSEGTATGSY